MAKQIVVSFSDEEWRTKLYDTYMVMIGSPSEEYEIESWSDREITILKARHPLTEENKVDTDLESVQLDKYELTVAYLVHEGPDKNRYCIKVLTLEDLLRAYLAMDCTTHCGDYDLLQEPDSCGAPILIQEALYGEVIYA